VNTEAAKPSESDAEGGSRAPRRTLSRICIALGSVLAMVAIFAAWADRQALNSDEWVDTSVRVIEDDEIRAAVADFAVAELYREVDVEAELQERLPPRLQQLAGPLANGLQSVARDAVEKALGSERFIEIWTTANAVAHRELIDVIEDRGDAVSTEGGQVTLQLRPLLVEAADSLGLSGERVESLPEDAGNLEILNSEEIELAQTVAKLIRGAALILAILALALLALGIYLRHGERWIGILGAGIGLILAGIFVLIVREIAGDELVKALSTGDAEGAADQVWAIGTSLLREIAWSVIWVGVLFVVGAWLSSPASSSVRARRALTPVLRDHAVAVYVVIGGAGLLWALTAVDGLRPFLVRAIITAMTLAGVAYVRERAIEENPEVQWGNALSRS
jgi:hypothetical protein